MCHDAVNPYLGKNKKLKIAAVPTPAASVSKYLPSAGEIMAATTRGIKVTVMAIDILKYADPGLKATARDLVYTYFDF